MYTSTTEADRLSALFEHGDIDLDEVIRRAVANLVENHILWLSFHDGSEWPIPQPWASSSEAA